jgi:choline dehydrogenase-like flavoprotein
MFVDARTIPNGTEIAADICIVGAGAAGITLARELADGKTRIALFESGGFEFEEETQNLYEGEIVGHPFPLLVMDRLRFLGGATNHWSGSCRPFDAIDFEQRAYVKNSGWPFDKAALDPFYQRAHAICQLGPYTYDAKDWGADVAAAVDFGSDARLRTGIYQYSPPTRFGEVYRQDLTTAAGLTVYLNANLVDIDTDAGARDVTGLRLACLRGPKLQGRGQLYVLATGGIENARLLLNANKVRNTGLGNEFDLVGRYFMDHPYIPNAATILFTDPTIGSRLVAGGSRDGYGAQFYFYAPKATLETEELPAFSIYIGNAGGTHHDFARASLSAILRALASGHWPDHLMTHIWQILRAVEAQIEDAFDRLTRRDHSRYSANYMCECPPDPESRVTLGKQIDALGLRRVELDWRLPRDFDRNIRRAHEILAQDLGRTGKGRLRLDLGEDATPLVATGHHHMGTTRMHHDPKQGVVDENCRVHGMANLFVAGSSVFPTYSFDDPTMTIVALALRLADHLKTMAR